MMIDFRFQMSDIRYQNLLSDVLNLASEYLILTVLQKKTWICSKSFFVIYFKTFRCLLCRSRNRNECGLHLRTLFCGRHRKLLR